MVIQDKTSCMSVHQIVIWSHTTGIVFKVKGQVMLFILRTYSMHMWMYLKMAKVRLYTFTSFNNDESGSKSR